MQRQRRHLTFEKVLFKEGVARNVTFELDESSVITSIAKETSDNHIREKGLLIPGFVNAHSHAFQYAMVGQGERLGAACTDDFWSWRERMYDLALSLEPESLKAVARCCYMEMLKRGITYVTEFHYLHRDRNGAAYGEPALMGRVLAEAANEVGLKMTLLSVFYRKGSFAEALSDRQRRFNTPTLDEYAQLIASLTHLPKGVTVGLGVHSLRAGDQEEVVEVFRLAKDRPCHIHLAEQRKEVEQCVAYWGARPVEWLLRHVPLLKTHGIVHGTHLSARECQDLASSQGVAILCPQTEANLGDGLFPFVDFYGLGGRFALGSDSQIGLDLAEDLRWLDYQGRLKMEKRLPHLEKPGQRGGDELYSRAYFGGMAAAGQDREDYFSLQAPLDGVLLDLDQPVFFGKSDEELLNAYLYAGHLGMIRQVYQDGEVVVEEGRHRDEDEIVAQYRGIF